MRKIGGGGALDIVLPPRCILCGASTEAAHALCTACWSGISFLGQPCCDCCGLPFPYEEGPAALCPQCIAAPPAYDKARAAMAYDDKSRGLVLALKHGDRHHGVPAFGQWLARAGSEMIAESDVIAPVPLHWTRLFSRRYNQSALLAYTLAKAYRKQGNTPPAVEPDLLIRRRRTPSQGYLSRTARALNVRGAFAVKPKAEMSGKTVLLIDDVLTTGGHD